MIKNVSNRLLFCCFFFHQLKGSIGGTHVYRELPITSFFSLLDKDAEVLSWYPLNSGASRAPYSYRKEKETHELIFLMVFSWARTHDDGGGVARHGGHTPVNRLTVACVASVEGEGKGKRPARERERR